VRTVEVLRPGPLATVQDLGRPGLAHLGVPRSGAVDRPALLLGNALVGNPPGEAAVEVTLGGLSVRGSANLTVAVTGARVPLAVAGQPAPWGRAVTVPAGAELSIGAARSGLRCYLAVAGGIAVPPVLGSRSYDQLSGLGPPPLAAGSVLPVGEPFGPPGRNAESAGSSGDRAAPSGDRAGRPAGPVSLRIRLGPRADWFTPAAIDALLAEPYTVTPDANRVGVRLAGPSLPRAAAGELPSEGMVLGAVQVPTSGQPVVFLADHPTTGGYPVIAVVAEADRPAVAQARPGSQVRFTRADR